MQRTLFETQLDLEKLMSRQNLNKASLERPANRAVSDRDLKKVTAAGHGTLWGTEVGNPYRLLRRRRLR